MGKGKHSVKKEKYNKQPNKTNKKGSKTRRKKGIKKVLIIILALIIIIAGIALGYIKSKLNKIEYVDVNPEELAISKNVNPKYRNIALLAVDSRNVNSNEGSRSDGMIVLSVNTDTKKAKLISVYRDTYVDVEGHGLTKITHAYAYGGPSLAINTLNRNLDLNISEFVTVNFEAVANIIDLMDGIEIDVKKEEIAEMNKYIKDTCKNTGLNSPLLTSPGKQKLNGVQAVTYGRIRKTTGGDYKRTERMRTVIMKAFEKAKKMNIGTLNKMVDTILPDIQTNIDSKEILSMISQLVAYEITDNTGWPYETKGKTLDAWYGIPITLESNVLKLHQEIFEDQEYVVPDSIKAINTKIINKTGETGINKK